MRPITLFMRGPANQTRRETRRLGLEFTSPLTAVIPGHILRRIQVFRRGQELTALAPLGMGVFEPRPRIAALRSTAAPSRRSLSTRATQISCTFHPTAA